MSKISVMTVGLFLSLVLMPVATLLAEGETAPMEASAQQPQAQVPAAQPQQQQAPVPVQPQVQQTTDFLAGEALLNTSEPVAPAAVVAAEPLGRPIQVSQGTGADKYFIKITKAVHDPDGHISIQTWIIDTNSGTVTLNPPRESPLWRILWGPPNQSVTA